jgi:hypothetical protein
MVYFVQCNGLDGPIKIGYVSSPDNLAMRMRDLQVGNPYPLAVVGTIKDASFEDECELHHKFEEYSIRGEWFESSKALKMYIRGHCLGGGAFRTAIGHIGKNKRHDDTNRNPFYESPQEAQEGSGLLETAVLGSGA